MRSQANNWEMVFNLQHIYLTNDWYPEYINNKSLRKRHRYPQKTKGLNINSQEFIQMTISIWKAAQHY